MVGKGNQPTKQSKMQTLKDNPYLVLVGSFIFTVGYGLVKLAAMVQEMQA